MKSFAIGFTSFLLLILRWQSVIGLEAAAHVDVDPLEDQIFTKDRQVDVHDDVPIENHDLSESHSHLIQKHDVLSAPDPQDEVQLEDILDIRVEEVVIQDDQTYLDLFGEMAKEFLTQKLIPTSDPECQWNWRHGRCEPVCLCDFQPKRGDFHLGRACRRRLSTSTADEQCFGDDLDASSLLRFLPTPMIQHMIHQIKQRSKHVQNQTVPRSCSFYADLKAAGVQILRFSEVCIFGERKIGLAALNHQEIYHNISQGAAVLEASVSIGTLHRYLEGTASVVTSNAIACNRGG
ncbi:hypothetical protein IV203_029066 [Nitzschia inconspicua]|uniref:Uncharacterized protein n=1 Tax=Nitzschia inconspicua TaxID=303405 RepID=A0A9K3LSV3_9STRA|nr:hypothetical protein IV203_029066 [Nitzschia inconspicua]